MTTYQIASLVIDTAGLGLIALGIFAMLRGTAARERDRERKHDETMLALRALIERTARS